MSGGERERERERDIYIYIWVGLKYFLISSILIRSFVCIYCLCVWMLVIVIILHMSMLISPLASARAHYSIQGLPNLNVVLSI